MCIFSYPVDHWLPATVHLQPDSIGHLHRHLLAASGPDESAVLLAQLNLLRIIRQHSDQDLIRSFAATCDLSGLLPAGLVHAQTEIRVAALAAICRQQPLAAASRLPSQQEADQLIEFVQHSVAEDDSRFRQGVESAMGALLLRYRDVLPHLLRAWEKRCQSSSGYTAVVPNELELGLAFLDRLQRSLVANLRPGGNYQRFVIYIF